MGNRSPGEVVNPRLLLISFIWTKAVSPVIVKIFVVWGLVISNGSADSSTLLSNTFCIHYWYNIRIIWVIKSQQFPLTACSIQANAAILLIWEALTEVPKFLPEPALSQFWRQYTETNSLQESSGDSLYAWNQVLGWNKRWILNGFSTLFNVYPRDFPVISCPDLLSFLELTEGQQAAAIHLVLFWSRCNYGGTKAYKLLLYLCKK